ncbi:serine/threonine-protein kinase [Actinomadura mexicana]|uniref:Serine/threonine protein kinase n=1 Tax=Actinomadura mexicana TaxID=134959 RepID=A0A239EGE7_9ACTN|nr:serine/threonine-protein kinase [Actinomadura mexicana]SNS43830.1 Serine/threonine protein kinase [Actinomadura mexicana]
MAGPVPLTAADPTRLGRWELLGRIGAGGQGTVYLGRPAEPGPGPARVAVKLLHAQLVGDANARERFVREMAVLERVAGFCTAQMLAADVVGDRPYIVSEYVPGPSLRALVRDEGPRTGAALDRLAISSVTALSAIHRANIVHRDLKPQNVLIGPDGPRVIDFGIARAFDASATMTSQVVGTPAYMAPEQFTGRVGPSADLFAWASTLLFAATGRDPFAGGPLPAVMYRILHETPDLGALPGPLAEVAAACLAKDPQARPTSEDVLLWLLGESERHARLEIPAEHLTEDFTGPTGPVPRPAPESTPQPTADTFAETSWTQTPTWPGSPTSAPAPPAPPSPGPAAAPGPAPGPVPMPGPAPTPAPLPRTPRAVRTLRRGPAVVTGLLLAALLAALDVAALAILIARPSLSEGHRGGLLPVVASSFAVVAVVTLVGVILAWRGSRPAAGTVMAARVARVAMWAAWGALVQIQPSALAGHALLTALVVLLLVRGLVRSPV